jgi:K+-transporting ATPase KdpF subunit
MTVFDVFGLIVGMSLLAYLFFALFKPEWFA